MKPSTGRISILTLWVAVGGIGGACAQDVAAARACGGVKEDAKRLVCYDKAFSPGGGKPEARFGDTGQLHAEVTAREDAPKSVTATVQIATPLAEGLYRLSLDNGQVWQTRRADWAMQFRSSDTVTISRMPLGGYQISMAGSARSVDVKRIK
jgi:hypothetical protein